MEIFLFPGKFDGEIKKWKLKSGFIVVIYFSKHFTTSIKFSIKITFPIKEKSSTESISIHINDFHEGLETYAKVESFDLTIMSKTEKLYKNGYLC